MPPLAPAWQEQLPTALPANLAAVARRFGPRAALRDSNPPTVLSQAPRLLRGGVQCRAAQASPLLCAWLCWPEPSPCALRPRQAPRRSRTPPAGGTVPCNAGVPFPAAWLPWREPPDTCRPTPARCADTSRYGAVVVGRARRLAASQIGASAAASQQEERCPRREALAAVQERQSIGPAGRRATALSSLLHAPTRTQTPQTNPHIIITLWAHP